MKKSARAVSVTVITPPVAVAILATISFVAPFFVADQQLVAGTIVNCLLFLAVKFLPGQLIWPMIFFPGLAVLSRGLIFGPLTKFLVIFLPFIWLGNLILILVFRKVYPKTNYGLGVIFSSLAKSMLLFASAQFFFQLNLIPRLFLQAMGANQLITALLGGLLAVLLIKKVEIGKPDSGN